MVDPLRRYGSLLDKDVPAGDPVRVAVTSEAAGGVVAERLLDLFRAEPGLDRVALAVDGQVIGTVTRDRLLDLAARVEEGTRSAGDGDGATLPGRSTGYVLLRFRCASCPAEVRLLFLDDSPPRCPEGHGSMERVR
ncbi:hypothetical protein GCM10010174_50540 [Kutzneria viridogrisea]|uniref:CBS domain-containing protein n=1 Tax=Kutzneria viridogrisea TaxID=47990 RepID=A0ABR6B8T7_9PSEU|nr:hypothetical protein [Kutzneria viridogrisea]